MAKTKQIKDNKQKFSLIDTQVKVVPTFIERVNSRNPI